MNGVTAYRCEACGWQGFPHRFWCPRCGGAGVSDILVEAGSVEETTTARRLPGHEGGPVRLATVLLDGGGRVIVRLDTASTGPRVRLRTEDGAFIAHDMQHA